MNMDHWQEFQQQTTSKHLTSLIMHQTFDKPITKKKKKLFHEQKKNYSIFIIKKI